MNRIAATIALLFLLLSAGCRQGADDNVGPGDHHAVITSITPATAVTGAAITLYGTGFGNDASRVTVTVDGVPATVTSVTDGSITFLLPFGATGGVIAVTVDGVPATIDKNGRITITGLHFPPSTATIEVDQIPLNRSIDGVSTAIRYGFRATLECSGDTCSSADRNHFSIHPGVVSPRWHGSDEEVDTLYTRTISATIDWSRQVLTSVDIVDSVGYHNPSSAGPWIVIWNKDCIRRIALADVPFTIGTDGTLTATMSGDQLTAHVRSIAADSSYRYDSYSKTCPTVHESHYAFTSGFGPFDAASSIRVTVR